MVSSERIQRALVAAAGLSVEEREELIAELILGLGRDREPEAGYDQAWLAELRKRTDAVVSGKSTGMPWSRLRREIEARLAERRHESA